MTERTNHGPATDDYEPVLFQNHRKSTISRDSFANNFQSDPYDHSYEDVMVRCQEGEADNRLAQLESLSLTPFAPIQAIAFIDDEPISPPPAPAPPQTRHSVLKAFDPLFGRHSVRQHHFYDDVTLEHMEDLIAKPSHEAPSKPPRQFHLIESRDVKNRPPSTQNSAYEELRCPVPQTSTPVYTQVIKPVKEASVHTQDNERFFRDSVIGHTGLAYSYDTCSLSSFDDNATYASIDLSRTADSVSLASQASQPVLLPSPPPPLAPKLPAKESKNLAEKIKRFKVPSFKSYYDGSDGGAGSVASRGNHSRKNSPSPSLNGELNENTIGGYLHWHALNKKEYQLLWSEIRDGLLIGTVDHRGGGAKFTEPLKRIITLSVLSEKTPMDHDAFEIATTREKKKTLVLAVPSVIERGRWLMVLMQNLKQPFGQLAKSDFTRVGKVYLKEGISGHWSIAWLLLQDRSLHRQSVTAKSAEGPMLTEDLRKTRGIGFIPFSDEGCCPLVAEPGPILVLNLPDVALYIQADLKMETENWCKYLKAASMFSGCALDQHQLTAHDIPVLVEKCIKFVSTHGSLSEGIYRRSGVTSKVHKLLTSLKQDACNFHISLEDYNEHDVASVLKRFFRTLPEPLLTNQLYSKWLDALKIQSHELRLEAYGELLANLPPINYRTLQALMGHLHSIHDQCEKNLMHVGNLASLWGPTLMTVENGPSGASSFSYTHAETDVVLQLIQYYPWLFDVDMESLERERTLQEALVRMQSGNLPKKAAGDMRLWIYTSSQPNADSTSITVNPSRTVKDVREEVASKYSTKSESHSVLVLMESVCNGNLHRPLHGKELVLPVILRWAQWPQEDCTNNRLIFSADNLLLPLLLGTVPAPSIFMVLRYADPKSKSFKKCPVEFCQARITCLKDTKNHTVFGQWDIENLVWYYGAEPKRSPPTKWVITFVEKDVPIKRSRDSPYFGHTLCFSNEEEYSKFTTSMLLAEYAGGLSAYLHHP